MVGLAILEVEAAAGHFEALSSERRFTWELYGRLPMLLLHLRHFVPVVDQPLCQHRNGQMAPSTVLFQIHGATVEELLARPAAGGGTVREKISQAAIQEGFDGDLFPHFAIQVHRSILKLIAASLWTDVSQPFGPPNRNQWIQLPVAQVYRDVA